MKFGHPKQEVLVTIKTGKRGRNAIFSFFAALFCSPSILYFIFYILYFIFYIVLIYMVDHMEKEIYHKSSFWSNWKLFILSLRLSHRSQSSRYAFLSSVRYYKNIFVLIR